MLRVRTRLAPSPIHGLGVFAAAPILAGEEIWRFTAGLDQELAPSAVAALPPDLRAWLDTYAYLDRFLGRWILCADEARYMNHSDAPNTVQDRSRDPYGIDSAVRDIAAGEELTCDYRTFEDAVPAPAATSASRAPAASPAPA